MFNTFENLAEVAGKVAGKVGAIICVHGNNISFHKDCKSGACMAIVYSSRMQVAYNTFGLQGETAIVDGSQLENLLRREVACWS